MNRARSAFTLPEIMFSIFILAVAVVSVMGLLAAGAKRQGFERDREIAGQLALSIVEAAFPRMVAGGHNNDLMTEAVADPQGRIVRVPDAILGRLTSADGTLERAIGSGRLVVFMSALAGFNSEEQMRVIAAFDTPLPATMPTFPVPSTGHPSELCRTLVCWSVDWTQFKDFESSNSALNGVATTQYGRLADTSTLVATEIGRFNLYNSAERP